MVVDKEAFAGEGRANLNNYEKRLIHRISFVL